MKNFVQNGANLTITAGSAISEPGSLVMLPAQKLVSRVHLEKA